MRDQRSLGHQKGCSRGVGAPEPESRSKGSRGLPRQCITAREMDPRPHRFQLRRWNP
jgi:hypothetical protein